METKECSELEELKARFVCIKKDLTEKGLKNINNAIVLIERALNRGDMQDAKQIIELHEKMGGGRDK